MAQAGTNFPKVRRMLFYVSPLIFGYFGQPPRCFTGTSLLPFRLFLRPILKFWSIGVTLMRITWANHSKRWILVSKVSMTYDGFCEFYTSDWFPYVWALPQNRWRLRRLISWNTLPNCRVIFNMPTTLMSPFFLRPFSRLFFNLALRIRALFPQFASTLGLVEEAFWRMPLFTEWSVQVPLR